MHIFGIPIMESLWTCIKSYSLYDLIAAACSIWKMIIIFSKTNSVIITARTSVFSRTPLVHVQSRLMLQTFGKPPKFVSITPLRPFFFKSCERRYLQWELIGIFSGAIYATSYVFPTLLLLGHFLFLNKSLLVTHFTWKKILNVPEDLAFDKVQISVPCFTSDLSVCNTPQVLLRKEIENYAVQMNNIILKGHKI